jgi:hypothetical protein
VVVVVVVVLVVVVVVRGAGRFAHAGVTNSVTRTHDDRSASRATFRSTGAFHHTGTRVEHRSTIYQRLEPILGEEEAEALLAQFPAEELDQLATKEFVRAEVTEVRAEIAELRTEIAPRSRRCARRCTSSPTGMLFSLMGAMVGLGGLVVAMTRLS